MDDTDKQIEDLLLMLDNAYNAAVDYGYKKAKLEQRMLANIEKLKWQHVEPTKERAGE